MKSFAIAAIAGLLSTSSFAYQIDTENCAGTAYIQDLDGKQVKYDPAIHDFVTEATEVTYKAWRQMSFSISSPVNTTTVTVENRMGNNVRFYYQPRYYNLSGIQVDVAFETFTRMFSTANDPRSSSGASLPAHTTGFITLPYTSAPYSGAATMHWESNECLKYPPIIATVHRWWKDGALSTYLVNNGNPW